MLKVDELFEKFNETSDSVKILAVLSPTCGPCLEGYELVKSQFKDRNRKLTGFVIWLPMLENDDEQNASLQAGNLMDGRIFHSWDGEIRAGLAYAKSLGLACPPAWDVYLIYSRNAKWEFDLPPTPIFWMHQLGEECCGEQNKDLRLNPIKFDEEIEKAIFRGKQE